MATSTPKAGSSPAPAMGISRLKLHWLSWIVGGLVSLALVLIVVPGVYVEPNLITPQPFAWSGSAEMTSQNPSQAKGPLTVAEYEHGWPWTYVRRSIGFGGKGWPKPSYGDDPYCKPLLSPRGIIVWWSVSDAWPLGSDASRWIAGALVADVFVALGIVLIVTASCEFWLRRRGGFGRFRIIDMLVAVGVIAVAISWWRWNTLETRANREAIAALQESPSCIDREAILESNRMMRYAGVYWAYDGPDWLCRLAGSPEFFRSYLFRVQKLAIDTRQITALKIEHLYQFDDLKELWIRGEAKALPADLLSEFEFIRTERASTYVGFEIPEYAVWVKK